MFVSSPFTVNEVRFTCQVLEFNASIIVYPAPPRPPMPSSGKRKFKLPLNRLTLSKPLSA